MKEIKVIDLSKLLKPLNEENTKPLCGPSHSCGGGRDDTEV